MTMSEIKFDSTINIGSIFALLIMLGSMLAIWVKIETSMAVYETKICGLEENVKEIKEELIWLRRSNYHLSIMPTPYGDNPETYE